MDRHLAVALLLSATCSQHHKWWVCIVSEWI